MTTDATSVRGEQIAVPDYLADTYWWAYVHPHAVRVFERQWLVNLILWGNFARLRDMALDALGAQLGGQLGGQLDGRTLQVACVYGDLTRRLLGRLGDDAELDVVDILPIQLHNLRAKLPADERVTLIHGDSARLAAPAGSYDRALLFFLLHEQPEEVRRATVAEALRVVRPGGRLVIVDYHRPRAVNPLYLPMRVILGTLEPYALDLWRQPLEHWLPADISLAKLEKRTMFSGLYQMLEITV